VLPGYLITAPASMCVPAVCFFGFCFGIHNLARQLHQERTQMEVQ